MGNENETHDSTNENQEKKKQAATTLDEILTDPDVKEEFDARIQEAVEAALAETNEGTEKDTDTPLNDGVNEEPSQNEEVEAGADEEDDARTKELEEREKNLIARELKATAIEELGKEQLPTELAECFNYESEEAYKNSKDSVVKAFQNALKVSVNSRLRGTKTPGVASKDFKGADGKSKTTSFANIVKGQNSRR